jgi:hypothetical protein
MAHLFLQKERCVFHMYSPKSLPVLTFRLNFVIRNSFRLSFFLIRLLVLPINYLYISTSSRGLNFSFSWLNLYERYGT